MVRGMTARQFHEWKAFAELEPFGLEPALLMFASIVHAIANVNRNSKKHPQPFAMDKFILPLGDIVEVLKSKPQTWQEQKALMMVMFPKHLSGKEPRKYPKRRRSITDPK